MRNINLSKRLAIISIVIIAIVFFAIISPLKGLYIFTGPLILIGIVLWIISLTLLVTGLFNRQSENNKKNTTVFAILLLISFIPIGIFCIKISGDIRTKITLNVVNRSDFNLKNVIIYGTGNIFENTDTLTINQFNIGDKIKYVARPSTKPHRNGYIKIEFDFDNKHISKDIAGEFSINPYNIQQNWDVSVDNEFVK